jgi:hypothetical protein
VRVILRCNPNYSESRPYMHIFCNGTCEAPHEVFWNVILVYEINLNVVWLFNDSACQDVFAAAHDLLIDLQKKISGNSDLRKVLIFESCMRTQAGECRSTSFGTIRLNRRYQPYLLSFSVLCLFLSQTNDAHPKRTLEPRIKPSSSSPLRIHTKYEATEYLLLDRTEAVVTLTAAWSSPPLSVLRSRLGIPRCRKYVIFGRLVHRLTAMDTSKLTCFRHAPHCLSRSTQKQAMLRNRATALEVSGTQISQTALESPSNVLATARWVFERGTWFRRAERIRRYLAVRLGLLRS